jgi:acetolactate synthase-1/2/3 large subunit
MAMNGAESLLRAAAAAGVRAVFANPGTTELPLVTALDRVPELRPVLGLFEGVCTGAADGYGRMNGLPALTVLHLGPGLANGLANLHNARRARTPVVNLVGDHPASHLNNDPPLASDIDSLAAPVSAWVRHCWSASEAARDLGAAVRAAVETPGVATLVVPSDVQWDDLGPAAGRGAAPRGPRLAGFSADAVEAAAAALREGAASLLLLDGLALRERGLRAAARVAAATGCRLLCERAAARVDRGGGLPAPPRLGYFAEQFTPQVESVRTAVLAGGVEPAAFFAYPGRPSRILPDGARVLDLARPGEDVAGALEALADLVGGAEPPAAAPGRPPLPTGSLRGNALGATLAALQPEGAIIVDESNTSGGAYHELAAGAPRHTVLALTGGAIGLGPPLAVGAAVACPDRPVINLQSDGSAMYTLQALWTQAREQLDVTTLVCSNRRYFILQYELLRAGATELGPAAGALTDLGRPDLDWVALARGMGVPAARAATAEDLAHELRAALSEPGPHLVEVDLAR